MLTALLGWGIIVAGLGVFAFLALWPVRRLIRGVFPHARFIRRAYWAAAVVLGTGLWFAIPSLVHGLFGRVAP